MPNPSDIEVEVASDNIRKPVITDASQLELNPDGSLKNPPKQVESAGEAVETGDDESEVVEETEEKQEPIKPKSKPRPKVETLSMEDLRELTGALVSVRSVIGIAERLRAPKNTVAGLYKSLDGLVKHATKSMGRLLKDDPMAFQEFVVTREGAAAVTAVVGGDETVPDAESTSEAVANNFSKRLAEKLGSL